MGCIPRSEAIETYDKDISYGGANLESKLSTRSTLSQTLFKDQLLECPKVCEE